MVGHSWFVRINSFTKLVYSRTEEQTPDWESLWRSNEWLRSFIEDVRDYLAASLLCANVNERVYFVIKTYYNCASAVGWLVWNNVYHCSYALVTTHSSASSSLSDASLWRVVVMKKESVWQLRFIKFFEVGFTPAFYHSHIRVLTALVLSNSVHF